MLVSLPYGNSLEQSPSLLNFSAVFALVIWTDYFLLPESGTEVTRNWLEVNSGVSVGEPDLFGPSRIVYLPENEVSY